MPISQMRKLKSREINDFPQGHITSTWQNPEIQTQAALQVDIGYSSSVSSISSAPRRRSRIRLKRDHFGGSGHNRLAVRTRPF